MRETILASALFLALAQIGNATPWDIETAPGQWSHNPDCTGQCAIDRSDAMQGHKPKPGGPVIVEEGNKGARQMLTADKSDYTPGKPYEQHWTGVCKRLPDGRIITHTAFLRDRATAHAQCKARLMGGNK